MALKQLEKAHEVSNFVELNFQRLNEGSLQQNATPAANLNIRLYALLAWPKAVSNRTAKAKGKSLVPRFITLGGDHTYVLSDEFPLNECHHSSPRPLMKMLIAACFPVYCIKAERLYRKGNTKVETL